MSCLRTVGRWVRKAHRATKGSSTSRFVPIFVSMSRRILISLLIGLTLTACNGASADTVVVPPTSTTLGPASEPLVAFEASWLCQVQRFAFAEASDIDAERDAALTNQGFSQDEYADFKLRLDDQPALRAEIRERFQVECAASVPVGESDEAASS